MILDLPQSFLDRPIAHRALHDGNISCIENGMNAVTRAIEGGYGIELDLQLSADGKAMVFHDDEMERLTELTGSVGSHDARTLGGATYRTGEQGIPTLDQLLQHVDGRAPLLLELKDQHGQMGLSDGLLEADVARALEGYAGDVALMSFNPNSIRYLARCAPNRPRGLTTCHFGVEKWPFLSQETREKLATIDSYEVCGASFVSHRWDDLRTPRLQELRGLGAKVLCWTVKSQKDAEQALTRADNITFEGFTPS